MRQRLVLNNARGTSIERARVGQISEEVYYRICNSIYQARFTDTEDI